MPPKKKIVSKVKRNKIQKLSDPLPTVADEKPVTSTANEEVSSTKEVNTPLVKAMEEKVNMVENNQTAETLKVVKLKEREEIEEADGKDSKIREDMAEEPNRREPGNKQTDKEETCEDEFESVSANEEENNDDNASVNTQPSLSENKKQKEFELHIGGLDKGASEDDLIKVFGIFGEIESIRIARHPVTQRSKGFAFIRYVSFDHTQKALAELNDGAEINGKKVRVSAGQNNTTLYIGNLCKNWTKERVLETLKEYGVEQIEDILLPDDPNKDGNSKGHASVEFKSHADATAALQRLRKPDAVFGLDRSAKVSFNRALIQPNEEDLLKVKTVYLEGLPKFWNMSKIREVCRQYGEIVRTELLRLGRKKGTGFVEFSSRDSAVACVNGFNNSHFEGNINIKAGFAKPLPEGRLTKLPKGGFKLQNDEDTKSANQKPSVPKKNNGKGKIIYIKEEGISNNTVDKDASNSQHENLKEKNNSETHQSAKGNKRGRKGIDIAHKHQPLKKACNDHKFNSRSSHSSNRHTPRQAQYDSVKRSRPPSYTGTSATQYGSNDLAPHAGLLPPASQARNHHAHDERRRGGTYHLEPASNSGAYYFQPTSSYGGHHLQPTSSYGAHHLQPTSSYGAHHLQPTSSYGAHHLQPTSSYGSHHLQASTTAYAGAAPPVVRSTYPEYSSYPPGSYQVDYVYPRSGTYSYPRSYY